MRILDCTLRDGGYYCDWTYSKNLVQDYLHAMASSGVDFVEIGLRSNVSNKFLGPFAYCTEDFLKQLNIPKELKIGVMLNASEFISGNEPLLSKIDELFSESKNSAVSLVRIACHLGEVGTIVPIIKSLYKKGYLVGINLMQIGGKTPEQINSSLSHVKDLKELEVLYYADSLGNMRPEDVNAVTKIFRSSWQRDIGIHTHDNMGMALSNTLEAVRSGVTWIDGTILGMGRGAGNVRTEYLLLEAQQKNWGDYHADAVFPIVQGHFTDLQRKYEWGTNLMYYISAQYKIHPTFVQTLISDYNYSSDRLLEILKKLSSTDSSSYSGKKLDDAASLGNIDCNGDWYPTNDLNSDEVLIVGSGDSISEHQEAIVSFIKKKKIPVLSLNINKCLGPELVSYYVASHPLRILFDFEKYKSLGRPLIAPLELLKKSMKKDVEGIQIKNLGMKISENSLSFKSGRVEIPAPTAIAYTLSMLSSLPLKKVYLVGFDGYGKGDQRNVEIQNIFDLFNEKNQDAKLVALTPTKFRVNQSSVYANSI